MSVRFFATVTLLASLGAVQTFAADDAPTEKPDAPKADGDKTADKAEKKGKGNKNAGGGHIANLFKLALQHATDINLTADQKEKLAKVKTDLDAQEAKLKEDPELSSLYAQIKDARKSDDREKAKQLQKQVRDTLEKKGGDPALAATKEAESILTADQIAKIKDIQKEERDKKVAAKSEKPSPPNKDTAATPAKDPEKPAPAESAPKTEDKAAPAAPEGGMEMGK
jgi:hypothetical protein